MIQANTAKRATASRVPAKNRMEAPVEKANKSNGNLNEKIAKKAYELYVARGCENGHDVEDWILAERIVKGS